MSTYPSEEALRQRLADLEQLIDQEKARARLYDGAPDSIEPPRASLESRRIMNDLLSKRSPGNPTVYQPTSVDWTTRQQVQDQAAQWRSIARDTAIARGHEEYVTRLQQPYNPNEPLEDLIRQRQNTLDELTRINQGRGAGSGGGSSSPRPTSVDHHASGRTANTSGLRAGTRATMPPRTGAPSTWLEPPPRRFNFPRRPFTPPTPPPRPAGFPAPRGFLAGGALAAGLEFGLRTAFGQPPAAAAAGAGGSFAGGLVGGLAGGLFFGPPGAAVGGLVGGFAGGLVGDFLGNRLFPPAAPPPDTPPVPVPPTQPPPLGRDYYLVEGWIRAKARRDGEPDPDSDYEQYWGVQVGGPLRGVQIDESIPGSWQVYYVGTNIQTDEPDRQFIAGLAKVDLVNPQLLGFERPQVTIARILDLSNNVIWTNPNPNSADGGGDPTRPPAPPPVPFHPGNTPTDRYVPNGLGRDGGSPRGDSPVWIPRGGLAPGQGPPPANLGGYAPGAFPPGAPPSGGGDPANRPSPPPQSPGGEGGSPWGGNFGAPPFIPPPMLRTGRQDPPPSGLRGERAAPNPNPDPTPPGAPAAPGVPTPFCRYDPSLDQQIKQNVELSNQALGRANVLLNSITTVQLVGIDNKLGPQLPNGGLSGALQKTGALVAKTWNFLQVDRLLNFLTYINTLHNAYMLSSNIAQTLFGAVGNVLNFLGLEDSEGNPIDVGQQVSRWTENFFKQLIGEERVEGIKAEWAKWNRIYQSAMNIIYTVNSIVDSTRTIVEIIGENVSKVGNALRRGGIVMENAYGWMSEKFDQLSIGNERWERLFTNLERVDDVASSLEMVTGEAVSIRDNVRELTEQREELKDALTDVGFGDSPDSAPITETERANKRDSQAPETLVDAKVGTVD